MNRSRFLLQRLRESTTKSQYTELPYVSFKYHTATVVEATYLIISIHSERKNCQNVRETEDTQMRHSVEITKIISHMHICICVRDHTFLTKTS